VTGKDRSNVDAQSMIHKINSAEVQEFVKNGQLIGYYGHQIRQRYGMNPPETVMIGDKIIRLEPAIRTIYLRADPDGNVTHKTEFLENDAGNHAMRQYMANVGGFSTACDYFVQPGGILVPRNFAGYDYVLQPNFVDNVGYALFDSIHADEEKELLEQRLVNLNYNVRKINGAPKKRVRLFRMNLIALYVRKQIFSINLTRLITS